MYELRLNLVMVSCEPRDSRGTWCVFSKNRCPAGSGRGALKKVKSSLFGAVRPEYLESTKGLASSPVPRKIATRSTAKVRERRSMTDDNIAFKSGSELRSRPNSSKVRR